MNCTIEINGRSYLGTFISQRGKVYDVVMARREGYDEIIRQMNCDGDILRSDGFSFSFNKIKSFDANKLSISFILEV